MGAFTNLIKRFTICNGLHVLPGPMGTSTHNSLVRNTTSSRWDLAVWNQVVHSAQDWILDLGWVLGFPRMVALDSRPAIVAGVAG